MLFDVEALRDFYSTPLGQVVRRLIAQHIRARWRHMPRGTMMGIGFPTPYLGSFRGEVARLGALMPAGQGALVWPPTGDLAARRSEGTRQLEAALREHGLTAAGPIVAQPSLHLEEGLPPESKLAAPAVRVSVLVR